MGALKNTQIKILRCLSVLSSPESSKLRVFPAPRSFCSRPPGESQLSPAPPALGWNFSQHVAHADYLDIILNT